MGGFDEVASEYVTVLSRSENTPAPWSNVVANPDFGFLVTESGSGFTWAGNSRENQLTPWSNDTVCDTPGEAVFLRDEESGEIWTPTALPIREETPYVARHGQGYSRFEHESHDVFVALTVHADLADPIKISRLTIENRSARPRSISVTAYAEWVLGVTRSDTARHVVSTFDADTGSLHARERVEPGLPESHRVSRARRVRQVVHGGSHGVSRPQRQDRPARRAGPRRLALRTRRRGTRSLRRAAGAR